MRPPPLNLLGLAPLARPPGWCQLPPTLGCSPGPGGVSTDLQTVLVETSKANPVRRHHRLSIKSRAHRTPLPHHRHPGGGHTITAADPLPKILAPPHRDPRRPTCAPI